MNAILLAVLMGILAGICRSVLGYIKTSADEDFSWGKFFKTLVIMAVTGLIIGFFTPDWKLSFALSFTGGVAINDLINAYLNRML